MKQYINANVKLPGSAYTLEFYGVYKAEKNLIVITESRPIQDIIGTAAVQNWTSRTAISVEVGDKELPIKHYHFGGGVTSQNVTHIQRENIDVLIKNTIPLTLNSCFYVSSLLGRQGLFATAVMGVALVAAATHYGMKCK